LAFDHSRGGIFHFFFLAHQGEIEELGGGLIVREVGLRRARRA
jgi:hypothetical protein